MSPARGRSALLVAALCLIWSSTWYGIRICLEVQPPLSSCAARFAIASVAMALVAPLLRRREAAPPPPTWLWIVTGVTNFAGGYGILYATETVVPSGTAAVLWAVFPVLMAASAVLFLGERLRPAQWLGFGVSFVGVVAVFQGRPGGIAPEHVGYAWLLLLSPLLAAVGLTLVKRYGSHTSSVLLNRNGMLLGAALLAAAAFAAEEPLAMRWDARVTLATLYLAVCGTALTFGIYFWLLRTAPASMLALINYVTPVLAMVLAELVGDGQNDLFGWLGAGGVVLGVVLVARRPRRR